MNSSPECWAVVPAAGVGQRMAASVPKQYLTIQDKTIFEYALESLIENSRVKRIIIALSAHDQHFSQLTINDPKKKIVTVVGGETRAHSVLNALKRCEETIDPNDFILVHDAARPCLTSKDLEKLIDVCLRHQVGGILAAKVADTIKKVEQQEIHATLNRDHIWRAFTPQMFKFNILNEAMNLALNNGLSITDEASAVEHLGYRPCVVESSEMNVKVTRAEDLALVEAFLKLSDRL